MKKKVLFSLMMCGLILAAQAQWTEQATGFAAGSRGIRSLCVVDTNVVWATAYDGVTPTTEIQEFTKTINGGTTWTPYSITGYTGWGLAMINAVDAMHAWIPAWNPAGGGSILYTADGGTTWTAQTTATFTAPNGFPNVVHFWDVNNGFCMGDPNGGYFEIYTTTNGGTTWNRVDSANIPLNLASEWGTTGYYSVVGDNVWFTTGKGRVYKSIDRGYHWTVASTPNTTKQMQIVMRSELNGIVQINESPYTSYRTTDGGATWTLHTPIGNFFSNEFCYVPGTAETYVSVGADITNFLNGVSYSTDDGAIWDNFVGSDTGQFLAVGFADANHGWAGAFNVDATTGGMWKYTGNLFVVDPCAGFEAFFSMSADTVDLNISGQVDFTNGSSGNVNAYTWDFGDGGSSYSENPTHTYTSTGIYYISLEVSDTVTCNDIWYDTIVVINTAGIANIQKNTGFEIYPNPANNVLNINGEGITKVEILNPYGQLVALTENHTQFMQMDISALSNGLYYIRVWKDKEFSNGRFVIRR